MNKQISKSDVFYQIFIDRFAGYDSTADDKLSIHCGGNIRGIINRLDYLIELGVSGIYLTPFLQSASYHGYDTTNFYEIDSRFGNEDDLHELISKLHENEMKLIMDFTANHVSEQHPFFIEAKNNPKSPYRDWFYFDKNNEHLGFLHFSSLPKLNLDNPETRQYVIDCAKHWTKEFDIDGIRLDHVVGPKIDFWREFYRQLHAHRTDVILIAEATSFSIKLRDLHTIFYKHKYKTSLMSKFSTEKSYGCLYNYYKDVFDAFFDFGYQKSMKSYARKQDLDGFRKYLDSHLQLLPDRPFLLFADNPDKSRIMFEAQNNTKLFLEMLKLQLAQPQPSVLYYGTELGMSQSQPAVANTKLGADTPARAFMKWDDLNNDEIHIKSVVTKLVREKTGR